MTIHLKTIHRPTTSAGSNHVNKKKFIFLIRVYLSDTNAQGNVYFARFFDWQGMAREEFLRVAVPNHETLFSAGLRLLTVEASAEYKREAKLYDEIEVGIDVPWMKRTNFQLGFTFVNRKTDELLAVGKQIIACGNVEGKLVGIPQEIKNALEPVFSC
jgi:YbgC/YbaW family acyl-CoA thioester hydrolase